MNHTIDVLSAENLPETGSVPAAFILCLIPAAVIFFSSRFRCSTFLRRAAAVLCSVPALFLCAGYLPAAQAQDTCTWNEADTWSKLHTAMLSGGCIKLTAPVTYDGTDDTPKLLQVPSGKTVTLDLNGNTINRGLAEALPNGYVISVFGTLNLTDSDTGGTITGGNNIFDGGGVYVAKGGTFTMTGGTISGNTAKDSGGGVYVYENATFTMSGGTISGNKSSNSSGGGVYVAKEGTFTMEGGTISGNKSSNGSGGGVYVYENATFTMSGGTIGGTDTNAANTADFYGGGVYVATGSTFTMKDGTISKNTADFYGGGVYVATGSTFTMEGGTISGNTAEFSGGGVYVYENATFTMSNGTISQNTVAGQGGGVYVDSKSIFTMNGGTITGNSNTSSNSSGGGVYNNGTFEMTDGTISGNTSSDGSGGGVYVASGGSLTMNSGTITGNTAESGGGVYVDNGKFTMNRGTISGNTAENSGGGVFMFGSGTTFTMKSGTISGNTTSSDGSGGGVYITTYSSFTMEGGTIGGTDTDARNTARYGGGVHVASGGSFTMKSGTISGNTTYSYGNGGGVYMISRSSFTMSGGVISHNNAPNGGGVFLYSDSSFIMSGGTISGNTSSDGNGGGVYVSSSNSFTMSGDSTITGNTASSDGSRGGGVYNNGTFTMQGGTIGGTDTNAGNTARYGGGVYVSSESSFTMSGGTVSGNTADYAGGGVYVASGTVKVSGSPVISGNVKGSTLSSGDPADVFLSSNQFIKVTGQLSNSTPIGVTLGASDGTGVFTNSENTGLNDQSRFSGDNTSRSVGKNGDGQLYLFIPVTVSGTAVKDSKVYDGSTSADITNYGTLEGADPGHSVSLDTASAQAAYSDKNVGTGKTVSFSGYSLSGNDAHKYSLTQPADATAAITPKPVTVTVTAQNRAYSPDDVTVEITGAAFTKDALVPGDDVTLDLTNATGSMEDDTVGINKSVTVTGITLKGVDAGNYALPDQITTTVTINKADWPEEKKNTSGSARYGNSGEIDLNNLIAPGGTAAFDSLEDSEGILAETPGFSNGKLQFTFSDNAENIGKTATVTVSVTNAADYNDYSLTVTLNVTAKDTAALEVTQEGTVYGGTLPDPVTDPAPSAGITPAVSYSGTLRKNGGSYGPAAEKPTEAGSYTVSVTYETDDTIYTGKSDFTIEPKKIAVPAAISGLKYTGNEQTGVEPGEGFTLTGNTGTEAGSHTATAALKDMINTVWSDGTADDKTISWSIGQSLFSVTVSTEGQGTAYADPASGETGTKVTLSAVPAGGWLFREWQVVSGAVTIAADNTFTLGTEDAEIKAVFHDTPYESKPSDEDEPETTGNDQTYVIGSGQPRQFRIARVEENGNDSAYDRFEKALEQADSSGGQVMGGIRLLIDGQPLPPEKQPVLHKDYDYSQGSVIITLYPSYLDTLPVGEYTMEAFFEEDNGEIETFPTHLSVTEPRVVKFISIKNDGSYNTPKDIDAAEYKLMILITAGDKILRQAENVLLKVQPDEKEHKPSEEEVQFTVLGEDNTLEISADNRIVITGLPKEVIGYGPEVYDAAAGTTVRPVQHRYVLSVREARFSRSGEILIYLLWDDGSRPVEEIRVVALPEDEIGAYQLRPDGTKEYLIFQTYDICMAYLGRDELCRGPERCYHK